MLEATYQARVAGWWQVQPSQQFIAGPGGGISGRSRPGRTLRDAWVFGLPSTIRF